MVGMGFAAGCVLRCRVGSVGSAKGFVCVHFHPPQPTHPHREGRRRSVHGPTAVHQHVRPRHICAHQLSVRETARGARSVCVRLVESLTRGGVRGEEDDRALDVVIVHHSPHRRAPRVGLVERAVGAGAVRIVATWADRVGADAVRACAATALRYSGVGRAIRARCEQQEQQQHRHDQQ